MKSFKTPAPSGQLYGAGTGSPEKRLELINAVLTPEQVKNTNKYAVSQPSPEVMEVLPSSQLQPPQPTERSSNAATAGRGRRLCAWIASAGPLVE